MSNPQTPRRQRRLGRIFDQSPAYFLTLCTDGRARMLANKTVFERVQMFCKESMERYGVFVDCHVLMPDHVHLIITIASDSGTTLGSWVKGFKAVVASREFKWQPGFFDHVLRSDESRSEKWAYIRMNPVRADLVEHPDDWPFAQQFNPFDGSEILARCPCRAFCQFGRDRSPSGPLLFGAPGGHTLRLAFPLQINS